MKIIYQILRLFLSENLQVKHFTFGNDTLSIVNLLCKIIGLEGLCRKKLDNLSPICCRCIDETDRQVKVSRI